MDVALREQHEGSVADALPRLSRTAAHGAREAPMAEGSLRPAVDACGASRSPRGSQSAQGAPRLLGSAQRLGSLDAVDAERPPHVEATLVDPDENRLLEPLGKHGVAGPTERRRSIPGVCVVELPAESGLLAREGVGAHERRTIHELPLVLRGIDQEERPAHVRRRAVIRLPAIAEMPQRPPLLELLEGDLELEGSLIVVGQEENRVERLEHGDHHRRHQSTIRRHDDLHGLVELPESEVPRESSTQVAAGALDDGHGRQCIEGSGVAHYTRS